MSLKREINSHLSDAQVVRAGVEKQNNPVVDEMQAFDALPQAIRRYINEQSRVK